MARARQAHSGAPVGVAAVVAVVVSLAGLVEHFPPDRFAFYPRCPFHALTGLLCPGCGMTRALAALVNGHLGDAWRWNPLVFLLLPLLAGYGAAAGRRVLRGDRRPWPPVPPVAIYVALGLVALFTVARNLV